MTDAYDEHADDTTHRDTRLEAEAEAEAEARRGGDNEPVVER